MTLRLTLSRDLRFGWLVNPDPVFRGILDAELCAATFRVVLLLSVVRRS